MKTFEDELKRAIDNVSLRPGLEGVGYDGGFIDGLEYAQELLDMHKNDAINEILTKYHEWAYHLPAAQFANWEDEEGDKEKTKARIRKEFIEFLKRKLWQL